MKRFLLLGITLFLIQTISFAQSNDNFANATFIEVTNTCIPDTFNSSGASAEPLSIAPNPSCGFYKGGDVWFKVVMPETGALRVEVKSVAGGINPQFALYSGTSGNLTQLSCNQLSPNKTYYNETIIGEDVFIRVYNYNSANGGEFSLCVSSISVPENNFFNDATTLLIGEECEPETYTNRFATPDTSSWIASPSCGFYSGSDVWFKAVFPESGVLRLEIENISTNAQSTIYHGTTGNITEIVCNQLDYNKTLYRPDLAGDSIFIRVFSYNSTEGGDFNLCLYEPEMSPNNFFRNAIHIDAKHEYEVDTFSNTYATASESDFINNPSCGFYVGGDVWFTSIVPESGAFRIETGFVSTNAQSSIYYGSTGNLNELVCNQLNNDKTLHRPDLAGDSIFIRIWSYNNEEGGDFSLALWEPDIPANDSCANAIFIDVKTGCLPDTFTNAYATGFDLPSPTPSCGFYSGGDVWFKFVLPDSGRVLIERKNIKSVNAQWAVYSGSCGDFVELDCAQLKSELLIDAPEMAGDTLYLRVFNYNSEEGGQFTLCLSDPDCSILDLSTSFIGSTIWANQEDAKYQWINCMDNTPLEGDTLQWLEVSSPGTYAVIVTQGSCSDTSACVDAMTVGLNVANAKKGYLYPNPAYNSLRLSGETVGLIRYEIFTIHGRKIVSSMFRSGEIDVSNLPSGSYILKLIGTKNTDVYRFRKSDK